MNKTIIFEGLDRCLKDTLIQKVKDFLPPSHILHYSKPPKTKNQEVYQRDSFYQMFKLIAFNALFLPENKATLILNRSHIGEFVYSPIYREYDGSYVFDLEKKDLDVLQSVYLITLVDSNLSAYLKRDDGNSFSSSNEEKIQMEIDRFKEASSKSYIPNKLLIDLNNYYLNESQINDDKILTEILQFIQ